MTDAFRTVQSQQEASEKRRQRRRRSGCWGSTWGWSSWSSWSSWSCDSLINSWTDILNKLVRDEGTGSSWGSRQRNISPLTFHSTLTYKVLFFSIPLSQSTAPPYTSTYSKLTALIPAVSQIGGPSNPGGKSWLSPTIKQNSRQGEREATLIFITNSLLPSSLSWSCSKIKHNKVTWVPKNAPKCSVIPWLHI